MSWDAFVAGEDGTVVMIDGDVFLRADGGWVKHPVPEGCLGVWSERRGRR